MSDPSEARSRRFANAVVELPSWKKKILAVSLVAALVGGGAKGASMVFMRQETKQAQADSPNVQVKSSEGSMSANSSGFAGSGSAATSADATTPPSATTTIPSPSFTERSSGWIFKLGLSIFVGVVFGTIFRMFIKSMAVLAAIVAVTITGLSYFKVLNIDFTKMKTHYDSATSWAKDQTVRLKDVVMGALPSTTMAAVGFFLGFKK